MYKLVWVGFLYTDVDLSEWMSTLRYGREPSVEVWYTMVYCRSCVREHLKVLEKFICVLFAGKLSKPVIDNMPIVFGGFLTGVYSKGFDFGYSDFCWCHCKR